MLWLCLAVSLALDLQRRHKTNHAQVLELSQDVCSVYEFYLRSTRLENASYMYNI